MRSFGIALCWNSKGYSCLTVVAAKCFLVISKTSVIITVLVWCWPRIDILLWYIWIQRLSTSDSGRPASSFYSSYCTRTVVCLPIYRSVSISFHAEFTFTVPFFDLYLYISVFKETVNRNKEIYSVLKFAVVCYIIFLLLAVLQLHLWKGSCLFRVLKDVKSHGHLPFFANLNCGSFTKSPYIKVCYFRYCSLFAEIDPAFQLNTGIMGLMFWTGLCINWNRPLLGWLDYCSE